mmetsp:Transcript_101446/g.291114  ORF Transcript_101446/g.291114 Transcript_101446/m.291114 type:complete len:234 (+) Transcript_101446:1190-1891(+)
MNAQVRNQDESLSRKQLLLCQLAETKHWQHHAACRTTSVHPLHGLCEFSIEGRERDSPADVGPAGQSHDLNVLSNAGGGREPRRAPATLPLCNRSQICADGDQHIAVRRPRSTILSLASVGSRKGKQGSGTVADDLAQHQGAAAAVHCILHADDGTVDVEEAHVMHKNLRHGLSDARTIHACLEPSGRLHRRLLRKTEQWSFSPEHAPEENACPIVGHGTSNDVAALRPTQRQ